MVILKNCPVVRDYRMLVKLDIVLHEAVCYSYNIELKISSQFPNSLNTVVSTPKTPAASFIPISSSPASLGHNIYQYLTSTSISLIPTYPHLPRQALPPNQPSLRTLERLPEQAIEITPPLLQPSSLIPNLKNP